MARVRVDIVGMSLWANRKTHWEVIFPTRSGTNEQHQPFLTIKGNAPGNCERQEVSDSTLHFEGLKAPAPSAQIPDWMLRMRLGAESVLRLPNASTSPVIVSTMHLPMVPLVPIESQLVGPVAFNGDAALELSYGTTAYFNVDDGASLCISQKGTTSTISKTALDAGASDLRIVIENLTAVDQTPECESTKFGEHLHESDDLLALCDMRVGVPRYFGEDLEAVCRRTFASARAPFPLSPTRLCPQGYCEDCI